MNTDAIATATPAEIDTEISRLRGLIAAQEAIIDRARTSLEHLSRSVYPNPEREAAANAAIADAELLITALLLQVAPFEAEYTRRGGWTRYYLVDAANGHVHYDVSSYRCSRQLTTSHYWLTSESGKTGAEVIELAGERVCTVCFPDAPAVVLNRPSQYRTKSEQERYEARLEREAKAAATAAKNAAAAITDVDGSPLQGVVSRLRTEREATSGYREAAAQLAHYRDQAAHALNRPSRFSEAEHEAERVRLVAYYEPPVARLLAALAAKHGVTLEEEEAAHAKQVAAKVKRAAKDAAAWRAANSQFFA